MAPEAAILKRKRSRPSDYWVVNASATPQRDDASPAQTSIKGAYQRSIQDAPAAGNRGRAKKVAVELQPEEENHDFDVDAKRKGKSSRTSARVTAGSVDIGSGSRSGLVAGRTAEDTMSSANPIRGSKPKGSKKTGESSTTKDIHQDAPPARKNRGRSSLSKPTVPLAQEPVVIPKQMRRGRSSNTEAELRQAAGDAAISQPVDGAEKVGAVNTGKKHKPRVISTGPTKAAGKRMSREPELDILIETASSKLTKGKQKPPVSSGRSSNVKPPKSSAVSSGIIRKSRKISGGNVTISKKVLSRQESQDLNTTQSRKRKEPTPDVEQGPSKRRRSSHITNAEDALSEIPERTPFAHLEPTVRRVSRLNIETKWEPLPAGCVGQVSIILSELQKPIIARLKEDRKKTQVSVALKSVSRKLLKKLSMGLPFPPAINRSREDDFDFEKILDHSRALESQLTTTIHSNKLLEAELSKEMARLEADQQNLADLEANAKRETTLRKERTRSLHPLLQADRSKRSSEYHLDVGLEEKNVSQSLDASIKGDEHLQNLVEGLRGHMDSIQGNINQVDGIAEGLAKAKGTIQARLFGHLDRKQYEAVILGSDG